MRCWHKELIKFLPDAQLKGQWRECVLIAKDIKETGKPNHLLVNQISNFSIHDFVTYCFIVYIEMNDRGFRPTDKAVRKIEELCGRPTRPNIFDGWHTKEYLRSNMANLWEKHYMGIGKSRITDEEWARLCDGYEQITGEVYQI